MGRVARRPLADRFWAKVVRHENGCWEWHGSKHRSGYGRLTMGGSHGYIETASRVSWLIHFGRIPDGLEVCHRCDNPECTRPSHLFLATHRENMRDSVMKGRASKPPLHLGSDSPKAKLTDAAVVDIRQRYARGERSLLLAQEYGVAHSTAKRIIARRYWRHVA